ncbi:MAG: beta-lactamase family protein [Chloroflexia bacterium]|nr:beta-lactamase family protein [Chloroflexia bacterium]
MTATYRDASLRRLSRRKLAGVSGGALAGIALGGTAHRLANAQDATPMQAGDTAFPVDDQLAFLGIVDAGLDSTFTPGALVGVWYPGRGTWLHAAGIGDVTTAAPVTLDDHMRIASNTKTFVATIILQLVDEGALRLDDSLESHIPGVPNGSEITLRQVLGMTAGIYDFVNDPIISEGYNADPLLAFTPQDALAIIRASTPDFAPGERAQYSNTNYTLLGMIAEAVAGQPIDILIAERILVPLGMTNTSFATTPNMPEPFAHGYFKGEPGDPLRDVTESNPDIPWASGAMISTLADLGIWAKALAEGTLISAEMHQERLQFTSFQSTPIEVGYGLGLLSFNGLLGHNGGILGYSSWVVHDPESGASIVVVTNRGGNEGGTSDPIFFGLASYLFPERFSALSPATPVATPAN